MSRVLSVCPGCGLALPSPDGAMDPQYNASWACRQLCGEVAAYTLALGDAEFLHQLVVDAYMAQHVGPNVKPIGSAFALIGLLLTFERGYSGRQVQRAHMQLANRSKVWPRYEPLAKALLTVQDVVQSAPGSGAQARSTGVWAAGSRLPPGDARNVMIREWGKSVWDSWRPEHANVRALVDSRLYTG